MAFFIPIVMSNKFIFLTGLLLIPLAIVAQRRDDEAPLFGTPAAPLLPSLPGTINNNNFDGLNLPNGPSNANQIPVINYAPANQLTFSQNGVDFLIAQEGFETKAYLDSAGILTIGVGHVILPGEEYLESATLTTQEVQNLLIADLGTYVNKVRQKVNVSVTQNMFDAMVSLCFNIGVNGFANSSVLSKINQGYYFQAADAFLLWNKITINGKLVVNAGLQARRNRERTLFLTGFNPT